MRTPCRTSRRRTVSRPYGYACVFSGDRTLRTHRHKHRIRMASPPYGYVCAQSGRWASITLSHRQCQYRHQQTCKYVFSLWAPSRNRCVLTGAISTQAKPLKNVYSSHVYSSYVYSCSKVNYQSQFWRTICQFCVFGNSRTRVFAYLCVS